MQLYLDVFGDGEIEQIERYEAGGAGPRGHGAHWPSSASATSGCAAMDCRCRHGFTFTPSVSLFVECDQRRAGRRAGRPPRSKAARASCPSTVPVQPPLRVGDRPLRGVVAAVPRSGLCTANGVSIDACCPADRAAGRVTSALQALSVTCVFAGQPAHATATWYGHQMALTASGHMCTWTTLPKVDGSSSWRGMLSPSLKCKPAKR